jgi:hypothetical protein
MASVVDGREGTAAGAAVPVSATRGCDVGAALLLSARMASSNVSPWARSVCAATLLPSPTIAASTIAPLISRRRPCWAAAAAASRMRRKSAEIATTSLPPGRNLSSLRPRKAEMSLVSRAISMLLDFSTTLASGSSARASSKCSSVTSR